MHGMWTIYCHTHITSGRRYIGQTKQKMMQRWRHHVRDAQNPSAGWFFAAAIRKYGPDAFAHLVLETCDTLDEANEAEKAWIESFSARHESYGFNLARGGREQNHQSRTDIRKRMSLAAKARWEDPEQRAKMLALTSTPEWREAKSAAAKAQWADPEVAAKNRAAIEAARTPDVFARAAATRSANMTDEVREKLRAGQVRRWARPGEQERASEAQKRAKSTPEYRAKASEIAKACHSSPETKAKSSAIARKNWDDPEMRARMTEGIRATRTPEVMAAIAAGCKVTCNTPEAKARLRAQNMTPEARTRQAAMKARPCRKCGRPRIDGRCRPCITANEYKRLAKRAVEALAGYVGERCTG
jgi:group I intron endonuclease